MTTTTCQEFANFAEDDVRFTARCNFAVGHPDWNTHAGVHWDERYGDWDRVTGLHDRSLTPTETPEDAL